MMTRWIRGKVSLNEELRPSWWTADDQVLFRMGGEQMPMVDGATVRASLEIEPYSSYPLLIEANGTLQLTFDWISLRKRILQEEYTMPIRRPWVSYLPFDYNVFPYFIRSPIYRLRRAFVKQLYPSKFLYGPNYTVHFFDHLAQISGFSSSNGNRSSFFLTYDTDSGWIFNEDSHFDRAMDLFTELGVHATWFVVLQHCRSRNVQRKLTRLIDEGHEIACHGIRHTPKLAFMSVGEIRKAFKKVQGFFRDFGIEGFRAPWLMTSLALEQTLGEFFRYDSSTATTMFFYRPDAPKGCCFSGFFRKGGLLVVPVSLPAYEELRYFGYSDEDMNAVWFNQSARIEAMGGNSVLVEHWDPEHLGREALFVHHAQLLRALVARGAPFRTIQSQLPKEER